MRPFHLAIAVDDLDMARQFYGAVLGCTEGRSSPQWIDFDLFGHQLTVHLQPAAVRASVSAPVDGHGVPIPHFGVVLDPAQWTALKERLRAAGVVFPLPPHTRWKGQAGEQSTMFVRDPAGNALEFKALADPAALFERQA